MNRELLRIPAGIDLLLVAHNRCKTTDRANNIEHLRAIRRPGEIAASIQSYTGAVEVAFSDSDTMRLHADFIQIKRPGRVRMSNILNDGFK